METELTTQTEQIKQYLDQGHTLTAIEALEKFHCFRLASRIYDLKQEGYKVNKIMITGDNKKRYAQYAKAG